jgi:hypothetical protein
MPSVLAVFGLMAGPMPLDVSVGSFATETRSARDFRFSPDSDHFADAPALCKSAMKRLLRRSKFGKRQQRRRRRDPELPSHLQIDGEPEFRWLLDREVRRPPAEQA